MGKELLSSARIKSDHMARGYLKKYCAGEENTFFGEGHAEIIVSTLSNFMLTDVPNIETMIKIVDEYRRCERIMENYKSKVNCDLSVRYGGNNLIYLVGDNITQESDLEIMARIKEESRRKSPRR